MDFWQPTATTCLDSNRIALQRVYCKQQKLRRRKHSQFSWINTNFVIFAVKMVLLPYFHKKQTPGQSNRPGSWYEVNWRSQHLGKRESHTYSYHPLQYYNYIWDQYPLTLPQNKQQRPNKYAIGCFHSCKKQNRESFPMIW